MESSELGGAGERGLKLFGVQIMAERGCCGEEEVLMRKSKSMGDLAIAAAEGQGGAEQGYLSDGGLGVGSMRKRGVVHQRKRGVPWTEEEHRTFLAGLEKLGKGDWKGISREFVRTRSPTQVASHAQKYFLRQSKPSKKKRRSSLFDVVPGELLPDAETGPTLPLKKASEDHQFQDNYTAGTVSFDTVHAVDTRAEDFKTANCSRSSNPQYMNLMAGITGSMTDQVIAMEHFNPTFHIDSVDFLKLLQYPHCPTQSPAALPLIETGDLELRIAPPQPPNFLEISSPRVAGAIRVI